MSSTQFVIPVSCSHVTPPRSCLAVHVVWPNLFITVHEKFYALWFNQLKGWHQIHEQPRSSDSSEVKVAILGRQLIVLENKILSIISLNLENGTLIPTHHEELVSTLHIKSPLPPMQAPCERQSSHYEEDFISIDLEQASTPSMAQGDIDYLPSLRAKIEGEHFQPYIQNHQLLLIRSNEVYDIVNNQSRFFDCSFSIDYGCFLYEGSIFYPKESAIWKWNPIQGAYQECFEGVTSSITPLRLVQFSQPIRGLQPIYLPGKDSTNDLAGIWVTFSKSTSCFFSNTTKTLISLHAEARFLGSTSSSLFYQTPSGNLYELLYEAGKSTELLSQKNGLFAYIPRTYPPEFLIFPQDSSLPLDSHLTRFLDQSDDVRCPVLENDPYNLINDPCNIS